MKRSILIPVFTLLSFLSVNAQSHNQELPFRNTALSTEKRVADLLGRLTLEEKAGQMMITDWPV
jgi:beta-glucosidase